MSDRDESAPKSLEQLPFPGSLCHRCAAKRYVETKTSVFILCSSLPTKYPRQPVVACEAFSPDQEDSA